MHDLVRRLIEAEADFVVDVFFDFVQLGMGVKHLTSPATTCLTMARKL